MPNSIITRIKSDGDADNTHLELPQPKSLPNDESSHSSEPVADSHDTDVKQVSCNHLQEYGTLPDNHLNHRLAISLTAFEAARLAKWKPFFISRKTA